MGLVKNLSIGILGTGFMVLATAAQANAVTLTYDRSIGSPGFGPGELFVPQGIAVDSQGNTLIANGRGVNPDGTPNYDLGNKIEIFNPSGQYIGAIGSGGTGPGQFDEPTTVDFSPVTGDLYSGDVYNNRINQFDSQGNFIRSFANGEFTPLVEGRLFFGPSGLTFDKDGNVYVGDFNGERILKYTSDGQQIGAIGGTRGTAPGQFQGVAGVRISPVSGNIFVADQYNNRVQVLDPNGNPLLAFGSAGSEPGQFLQPIGIEVDEEENIYVADSINSRVQVFDKNGNFLTSFGQPALDASGNPVPPPAFTGPPFGNPLDLTPGRFNWTGGTTLKDDKLYVGDFFQGRVQVLNIEDRAKVPESSSALGLTLLGLGATTVTLRKRRQQKSIVSLEKA
ncbi:scytonemin biosynthesis PEP-CTERM protein ScyF [Nostocaceae cyanobacterium CENA357]|uniref:Scytonemin biosynthesis PEP-CTERM protein ScyF n=1 Tax=Atlanticothrix silvestris CENA357 TaxID=1725252 RepID=A0A8J7L3L9_9CYAN|nr:scytonemin biosynthesis PEP-CTERM protein ScyF [Atlanticothrix silvestris]MBH8554124.1 scytonemin biosynthesis PEP-CTERM protein ScyF [Atlanticothrix silvestris CENA357]